MAKHKKLKLLNLLGVIVFLGFVVGSLRQVSQSTLTINVVGKGEVNYTSGIYRKGRNINLKSTGVAGWRFDHWSGDISGKENPKKVSLIDDVEIKAVFYKINNKPEVKSKNKEELEDKDKIETSGGKELGAKDETELQKKEEGLEKKEQEELEKKRQEELERKKQEELEKKRQAELERKKQEELEKKRQAELERKKQEELEKKRQEELARKRKEELERKRQAELERKRKERLKNKEFKIMFGQEKKDLFKSVKRTSDGGYILAGWTESFASKAEDAYIVKTDYSGKQEWYKTFGGENIDRFYSVQQCSDGGYILAGLTKSFGAGRRDAYVVKLNNKGNVTWAKKFGEDKSDWFEEVRETADGGYILVGSTSAFGIGGRDGYIVKVDKRGNKEWDKVFRVKEGNEIYSVETTSDGGFVVVGYSGSPGNYQGYLAKLNYKGNKEWSREFGGQSNDKIYSITKSSNSGYILAGWTESFGAGGRDGYVIKVDSKGKKRWSKTLGGKEWDVFTSVKEFKNGDIVLVGETKILDDKGRDGYIVKLTRNGIAEWSKLYGGKGRDIFEDLDILPNNSVIIAGSREVDNNDINAYLVKVNLK
ncbi:InlB B-repeat-containing protein [Orenia marismortui]|uniref:InlB B-repeat-containing protein n=1 Tax=Orenia marismortui TaxID=46469 RepID=UPI0003788894|nr:hypothetical protein [Orenia marismortui]